jgi:NAD+ synthase
MTILYAIAQTARRFVMGTSNLSERILGYFTKWGDGASDLNPLGTLVKSEVRILARALGIPKEIIEKAPSADLFEGQTDESDLGVSYAEIDAFALTGSSGSPAADKKIKARMEMSLHKNSPIPLFTE